ncbi:MAG: DUF3408 domain-containing protein [Bacteroidetes bacterium]|nr:DUF3408 domain-containing protein [Bacteroidota bacterium]
MTKKKLSTVNENFMKDIISKGVPIKREIPVERIPKSEPRFRDSRKRKEIKLSYVDEYLRKVDFENRQMVTITRQTHTSLSKIINILGSKQSTLGGYLENIVRKHFELHKDEINRLCQEQPLKPL